MADKTLRKLIFNDKYLIITALILALIVWVVTSLNIGTDETRKIRVEAPIKLSDELQEQLGMEYYTLQRSVDIDVTISGAKYVIGQVDEDDIKVKFDTSNVTRAGEQSIPIQVSNKSKSKDFTITSVYPTSVDAYFDVEETKNFDVSIVYDNDNVADGYIFGTPSINEDKITVKGPKTYVDLIKEINAEVDFKGNKDLKETYAEDCALQILGSGVEPNYIKMYSQNDMETELKKVEVTLPVLNIKTLPVSVDFENAPKNIKKDAIKTEYSVDELKVGILESTEINKAIVGTINYNELEIGKNEFTFDTSDVQGGITIDGEPEEVKVTVTVSDDYEEYSVPISTSDVEFKSVPKGSTARVRRLNKYYVRVVAPKEFDEIKKSDLKIVADVSKIKDDECKLEITVKSNKSSWVLSNYSAYVDVTES